MRPQHIVSISGGKDSVATALIAKERGRPFRAVFADTGNEHPITIDYVAGLERHLGVLIETVKADFTRQFEVRRRDLQKHWSRPGRDRDGNPTPPVPQHLIDRALECLVPTGIPFLDLCMLKGRFPGAKSRFCTDELKLRPMDEQIKLPLLNQGATIVEWIGERAQESPARAAKPRIERMRWTAGGEALGWRVLYRAIHHLLHEDVFAIAKRHGVPPNPLYLQGMGRVGCMPCILVKKRELRAIAARFPEHIDRIEQWEAIVRDVARRGEATFLCAKTVPGEGNTRANIRAAVEWSRTSRGGWNYDLEHEMAQADAEGGMCESAYGLCE